MRERFLQFLRHGRFLQHFTRNVEGKVVRVHKPAHKAQVVRQELLGFIHDEDALHKKLEPVLGITVKEIPRGLGRDVKKRRVLKLPFNLVVTPDERIVISVRQVLIKLLVLLVLYVARGDRPEGLGVVNLHPLKYRCRRLFPFFRGFSRLFLPEINRYGDVIRILRDRCFQNPGIQKLLRIRLQMQHDVCAALLAVNSFSRIGAQAFAFPADAFVLSSLCRARVNRYFIGDNKGRIKADAKAPDQLRVLGGVTGERLKEFIGT